MIENMSKDIDVKHPEYTKWLPIWEKIRDAIAGQDRIKYKREKYLKPLSGQTPDSYNAYLNRAQFVDYSARTVEIGLGQLFRKTPTVLGIDEELTNNASLDGKSAYYLSKTIAQEILELNRIGVLVDFSEDRGVPYLTDYKAESIINWKTEVVNGQEILTLVVIEGEKETGVNKYTHDVEQTWRTFELEMVEGSTERVYIVRDWAKIKGGQGNFRLIREYTPIMNSKPLPYIPFYFLTTNAIDFNITKSPMLGFVNVNLGHYNNSADYENMLHWTGAKTPIFKGYSNDKIVTIGSAMVLENEGDAYYLEASSDSGLKEELHHKESQMASLGTSLISGSGRYVQSAETARISSSGEYASLADISNAMSKGVTKILKVVAEWSGATESTIKDVSISYNTDFEQQPIDPATLTAFSGLVHGQFMSWETMFYNLKNMEVYPDGWTPEEEKAAIEEGQESFTMDTGFEDDPVINEEPEAVPEVASEVNPEAEDDQA